MATMPNFLLLGAPKAGTTALYHYLKQHPQVFMSPVKEPNFFAFEGENTDFCGPEDDQHSAYQSVTTLSAYQALYEGVRDQIAIGEASTLYLYIPKAAQRIHHYIPEAKLIAILRHPADRAYSHFLNLRRDAREGAVDFAQALNAEPKRIQQNWAPAWHFTQVGFYAEQIQRYLALFPRQQLKIYLYEDWQSHPIKTVQEILEFIEVDPDLLPDMSEKHNVSSFVYKRRSIYKFLMEENLLKKILRPLIPAQIRKPMAAKAFRQNIGQTSPLSPEIRNQLISLYYEDILKLQDLIQRDLSHWLI